MMTMVDTTIITATIMNNGPTVPRTDRLKARNGIVTGAALILQNRIGCRNGEIVTVAAVSCSPVTALANESSRVDSSSDMNPTSAKARRGASASCRSAPIAANMAAYPEMRSQGRRRSAPKNRASAISVKKDHDQNVAAEQA